MAIKTFILFAMGLVVVVKAGFVDLYGVGMSVVTAKLAGGENGGAGEEGEVDGEDDGGGHATLENMPDHVWEQIEEV